MHCLFMVVREFFASHSIDIQRITVHLQTFTYPEKLFEFVNLQAFSVGRINDHFGA